MTEAPEYITTLKKNMYIGSPERKNRASRGTHNTQYLVFSRDAPFASATQTNTETYITTQNNVKVCKKSLEIGEINMWFARMLQRFRNQHRLKV